MKHSTSNKIYFIQGKTSGEFLKFGAKVAWSTSAAAKNAFNLHMRTYYGEKIEPEREPWERIEHLFDKQCDYELVCLDTLGNTFVVEK